ncbi:hypothetical protein DRZ78_02005 [Candidatus Aerophobetes bacterium]|uniref:Uncharacterized protein n=1 Tax=Aerophobetes bacterium TaxID=2030807 RepID=A0A662D1U7_UNCAE|nr:MAG: hypothetical protein DRZ78_02005 [Candidatus Aerophobetes bacterium]
MELVTPAGVPCFERALISLGHSKAITLPKVFLKKINIDLSKRDSVYVFPVWSEEIGKWLLLIAIDKEDWEP